MHVFSILNPFGSETVCRENGYCCSPSAREAWDPRVDDPGLSPAALLGQDWAWAGAGLPWELGLLGET